MDIQLNAHPEIEKEVIRVLKKIPKVVPGAQRGVSVSVIYSLPVIFQIE